MIGQVTPGPTVKKATVFIAAAVLVQEVPHLWLKEGHIYVNGDHLRETSYGPLSIISTTLRGWMKM